MDESLRREIEDMLDAAFRGGIPLTVNGKRQKVKEIRDTADVQWVLTDGVLRGVKKGN